MSLNLSALEALPKATKTPGIAAYLLVEGGGQLTFLYNPSEKSFSTKAVYTEAATFGTRVPGRVFQHAGARTLRLSNLLVDTFADRRNLQPLIDSYINLTKSYQVVRFIWGQDSFGPAVVESLDWTETKWLNGAPAFGLVNLSLTEIPGSAQDQPVPFQTSAQPTPLTQRQQDNGVKSANSFLQENQFKLRQVLTSTSSDTLAITPEGLITKGREIIGNWNGLEFTPDSRLA